MRQSGRWLALILCIGLCAPIYAQFEEFDAQEYSLPWRGESPHWTLGQEFSAVMDAPFIGTTECLYCHEELQAGFLKTAHARSLNDDELCLSRQGCEGCHGAGGAHAILQSRGAIFAFDWQDPEHTNRICLRCHEWLTSQHEWDRIAHARAGLRCTTCHDPHVGPDHPQRFLLVTQPDMLCINCHHDVGRDFVRFSHHPVKLDDFDDPGAQAILCDSCHDVHRGKGFHMLAQQRVQDICLRCHIDKGGPFRFAHLAATEGIGDGCATCHLPHGSDNMWLHVADGRALCVRCHTDREEHNQPLTCWTTGCHARIHGSNNSALFF